jgi:transcriptional regulator with XRE-family HTH domain
VKIGNGIKNARGLSGLSQRELSNRSRLSITYISEIENGKKDPSIAALRAIAGAIQMELPFMVLLSMEEADVDEENRKAFNALKRIIENKLKAA